MLPHHTTNISTSRVLVPNHGNVTKYCNNEWLPHQLALIIPTRLAARNGRYFPREPWNIALRANSKSASTSRHARDSTTLGCRARDRAWKRAVVGWATARCWESEWKSCDEKRIWRGRGRGARGERQPKVFRIKGNGWWMSDAYYH